MFFSHCLLSRNGPLRAIWVAAYCFKKLNKSLVKNTDISFSVDKILQDEFDMVTYRVLAYLLLGVVRVYSKKVEYLFDDCNKVLLEIKDYAVRFKDSMIVENLQRPYFSITLPKSFELDAFDLDILEESTGYNVLPPEEITLKDKGWKSRGAGQWSLDKYHYEEFAVVHNTFFSSCIPNEDVHLSQLVDFDMGVRMSRNKSSLKENMEKPHDHTSSRQECEHVESSFGGEDWALMSSGQSYQAEADHTNSAVVKATGKMPAEGRGNDLFGGVENESLQPEEPFDDHNELGGDGMETLDIEMHEVVREEYDLSHVEAIIEKLQESIFSQKAGVDTFCAIEEAPQNVRPLSDELNCNAEGDAFTEMTLPGKEKNPVVAEEQVSSVTHDATPQSKFRDSLEDRTPEFSVIHTPAARERPRIQRKRKCTWDDLIIFPNDVMKKYLNDPSDLVFKRRKLPHTTHAIRKSQQSFNLPRSFLKPLIPCALELASLLYGKNVKIPESVDIVEVSQKLPSECPTPGSSIETVKPLDPIAESCNIGRSVEPSKPPEKLDVPGSHPSGESTELSEKLDVLESHPFVRIEVPVVPAEMLNVSGSPHATQSLAQMPLAPETPVQLTAVMRSCYSPERSEISESDRVRLGSNNVNQAPSTSRDGGFYLNLMDEDISCSVGDDEQDHYGWSAKTRVVAKCLHQGFLYQKERRKEEVVNLMQALEGRTKKESARVFYEILVLNSKGFVHVKQENAYGDILVWKTRKLDQLLGPDCP